MMLGEIFSFLFFVLILSGKMDAQFNVPFQRLEAENANFVNGTYVNSSCASGQVIYGVAINNQQTIGFRNVHFSQTNSGASYLFTASVYSEGPNATYGQLEVSSLGSLPVMNYGSECAYFLLSDLVYSGHVMDETDIFVTFDTADSQQVLYVDWISFESRDNYNPAASHGAQ